LSKKGGGRDIVKNREDRQTDLEWYLKTREGTNEEQGGKGKERKKKRGR